MLWEHSVAQSRCSLSKAWLQICWIKSEVEQNQEKRVKKKIFFLRPHFPQLLYRLRGRRFAFLLITSARLHKRCQAIHRDTHTHVASSCHPPVCSCCDRGCWLSVVYVSVCVCVCWTPLSVCFHLLALIWLTERNEERCLSALNPVTRCDVICYDPRECVLARVCLVWVLCVFSSCSCTFM